MLTVLHSPAISFAQSIECGVDAPASWGGALHDEVELIQQYSALRGIARNVPVKFVHIVKPVDNPSTYLTETDANVALSNLNTAFLASGITFSKCGEISIFIDAFLSNSFSDLSKYMPFNYTTGALTIFIRNSSSAPQATLPCPIAYQTANPNYAGVSCNNQDNTMQLNSVGMLLSNTFFHEVGHHLGLIHTYAPTPLYITPVTPNQQDHPYPVLTINGDISPLWWGRELAIRTDEDPTSLKQFKSVNALKSGDFVGDTHADCREASGNVQFPGCKLMAQNSFTCEINSTLLTYKDYNNDPIFPAPGGGEFGRNYMSYWKTNCLNHFTQGQMDRTTFYYDNYRSSQYGQCGNFDDNVEHCGTATKIPYVTIRTKHEGSSQFSNATTNSSGAFSSMLFNGKIKADVYHNGRGDTYVYPNTDNRHHKDHLPCEWVEGVDAWDLILISRYILGLEPLDGYEQIAADANKSGTVTGFDYIELRKLILGTYAKLPAYDQPWRFVPEFVVQDNPAGFDANAFAVTISGMNNPINAALLTDFTNQTNASSPAGSPLLFSIPNTNGQKGFDAIKIGDAATDWVSTNCTGFAPGPNDEILSVIAPTTIGAFVTNDIVELSVKSKNFSKVQAFQFGLEVPSEYFEVVDVVNTTLPDYSKEDCFGLAQTNESEVKTLWFSPTGEGLNLEDNTTLFTLKVKMKQPIADLGNMVKLKSNILKNKIWQEGSANAQASITLHIGAKGEGRTSDEEGTTMLSKSDFCALSNPFSENFALVFNNHQNAVKGQLRIIDMLGGVKNNTSISLINGINTIQPLHLNGSPAGLYTAELTVDGKVYSTKILKQ